MADLDIKQIVSCAVSLLDSADVIKAADEFKADTSEKEIAKEYVVSYSQFIIDVAEKDSARQRIRSDTEIREYVGHINSMLKLKQPDVFMKMILNAPKHYKAIMKIPDKTAAASPAGADNSRKIPEKKK